ncbi:MAG: TOBE domain-containing protein [Candidatus Eiseniibacteriota bacterium]
MARSLTSTEICDLLGISSKTLYHWERSGKIPSPGRNRRGWRVFTPKQVQEIRRYAEPARKTAPRTLSREELKELSGLTARNQLRGVVVSIASDGLLSEVVLRLGDGQEIVSVVTRSSVKRLGLKRGQEAVAVIKATEVMLFT